MAGRYMWPDDATFLVDLDTRRGVRMASGDLPLEDAVAEALSKARSPYDVEVRQNGKGGVLALRWPADDYTITLLAQGVWGAVSDKPWDSVDVGTRNYWLREARDRWATHDRPFPHGELKPYERAEVEDDG